jgi:hypothetical protein
MTYHPENIANKNQGCSNLNVSASIDIPLILSLDPEHKGSQESLVLRINKSQSPSSEIKMWLLNVVNPIKISLSSSQNHKQHILNCLL